MEEHRIPLKMENISAELLPAISKLMFAAKIITSVGNDQHTATQTVKTDATYR
jgi:hypothetical protein